MFFNGYVYFGAINDSVKAFQLTNGLLSAAPTSQTPEIYQVRGSSFAISANTASNGILWALQNNGMSADSDTGNPGVLFAYNANNLSTELYNSAQARKPGHSGPRREVLRSARGKRKGIRYRPDSAHCVRAIAVVPIFRQPGCGLLLWNSK